MVYNKIKLSLILFTISLAFAAEAHDGGHGHDEVSIPMPIRIIFIMNLHSKANLNQSWSKNLLLNRCRFIWQRYILSSPEQTSSGAYDWQICFPGEILDATIILVHLPKWGEPLDCVRHIRYYDNSISRSRSNLDYHFFWKSIIIVIFIFRIPLVLTNSWLPWALIQKSGL